MGEYGSRVPPLGKYAISNEDERCYSPNSSGGGLSNTFDPNYTHAPATLEPDA